MQTSYILPEPKPKSEDYAWLNHGEPDILPIPPLVTRHYAVLTRTEANQTTLVVLQQDGTARTLADAEPLEASKSMEPISVLLPDGRGLVVANQGAYSSAFLLDEHGTLLTHRWLLAGNGERLPAAGPEGPGVVCWTKDGDAELHSLVAGSQSRALPAMSDIMSISACTKPRDPAATLVYIDFPYVILHVSSTPTADAGAGPALDLFEARANQICLRGASTLAPVAATLTAQHGVLRGTATDAQGTTVVTCRKKMQKWKR